jgi:hypothetical protein
VDAEGDSDMAVRVIARTGLGGCGGPAESTCLRLHLVGLLAAVGILKNRRVCRLRTRDGARKAESGAKLRMATWMSKGLSVAVEALMRLVG